MTVIGYTLLYVFYEAWANSVDLDETRKRSVSSGSTLFGTHPAILDTTVGNKLDLFKI